MLQTLLHYLQNGLANGKVTDGRQRFDSHQKQECLPLALCQTI